MEKVSFIIPAYEVERYIGQCIESILAQSRDNWEAIIVDDGSFDNTYAIAKQYEKKDDRIKVYHKENGGVSSARNFGMSISKGKWICFIDGDDTIDPRLLEVYENYLVDQYDVCFISHREVMDKDFGKLVQQEYDVDICELSVEDFKEFKKGIFNRDIRGKYDYHKVKLATPIKFYRKAVINNYDIVFPEKIVTGEDAVFNLEFYNHATSGVYISLPLYYHRIWSYSVSQRYNINVERDFENLHTKLYEIIEGWGEKNLYLRALNERKLWSMGFYCILKYCHPDNKENYWNRKKEFLNMYKNYKYIFSYIDWKDFRLLKRIFFLLIKYKQFLIIDLLCKIKNINRRNK